MRKVSNTWNIYVFYDLHFISLTPTAIWIIQKTECDDKSKTEYKYIWNSFAHIPATNALSVNVVFFTLASGKQCQF